MDELLIEAEEFANRAEHEEEEGHYLAAAIYRTTAAELYMDVEDFSQWGAHEDMIDLMIDLPKRRDFK